MQRVYKENEWGKVSKRIVTDRQNTPFKLMFGESLVVILLSFESTKYLTIEDKMKPSYKTDKRH